MFRVSLNLRDSLNFIIWFISLIKVKSFSFAQKSLDSKENELIVMMIMMIMIMIMLMTTAIIMSIGD